MKNRFLAIFISTLMLISLLLFAGCDDIFQQISDLQDQLEDLDNQNADVQGDEDDSQDTDLPYLPAELIPLDVIMDSPEYTSLQISSDGEKIMYRHMTEYSDDFIVEDWKTGEMTYIAWPSDAAGIPGYLLAPDGETVLLFVDDMGDENYGLYTSNIVTGLTSTIFPAGGNDCRYVADYPANEDEIYITKFDFTKNLFDLYLLNYITGENSLILGNSEGVDIIDYIFDNDGNLRSIGTIDSEAGVHYFIKNDASKNSTEVC